MDSNCFLNSWLMFLWFTSSLFNLLMRNLCWLFSRTNHFTLWIYVLEELIFTVWSDKLRLANWLTGTNLSMTIIIFCISKVSSDCLKWIYCRALIICTFKFIFLHLVHLWIAIACTSLKLFVSSIRMLIKIHGSCIDKITHC